MPIPLALNFFKQSVAPYVRRLTARHRLRQQIKRERRSLSKLDDRLLSDIGVTRENAKREAERPPNDIPLHRLPAAERCYRTAEANPLLMIRLGA